MFERRVEKLRFLQWKCDFYFTNNVKDEKEKYKCNTSGLNKYVGKIRMIVSELSISKYLNVSYYLF